MSQRKKSLKKVIVLKQTRVRSRRVKKLIKLQKLYNPTFNRPSATRTFSRLKIIKTDTQNKVGEKKIFNKLYSATKKTKCRVKYNDALRRSNFFASKARGGSARPEHKQTHKRTC
ncbi:hypothetical protein [Sulfurovum sp.]|uniref:hypothetical protein n=1 Tax=Sulfurovum sp. TaxID=1969726 RepID=UPI00356976BA